MEYPDKFVLSHNGEFAIQELLLHITCASDGGPATRETSSGPSLLHTFEHLAQTGDYVSAASFGIALMMCDLVASSCKGYSPETTRKILVVAMPLMFPLNGLVARNHGAHCVLLKPFGPCQSAGKPCVLYPLANGSV